MHPHTTGQEGPRAGSICGTHQSSGNGDSLKFQTPLGGEEPNGWMQAHAYACAPSPGQTRLTLNSFSQAAGLSAQPAINQLCLVSGHFVHPNCGSPDGLGHYEPSQRSSQCTFPEAETRNVQAPSLELVLISSSCFAQADLLIALKDASPRSSWGERRRGGGEENARQWRQPRWEGEKNHCGHQKVLFYKVYTSLFLFSLYKLIPSAHIFL